MSQQLAYSDLSSIKWISKKSKYLRGMLWESNEGEYPVQVWMKSGCLEMRFGNRIVQSSCLKSDPNKLLLSYTRHMMIILLFSQNPQKALHIGLGGGSIPLFLDKEYPNLYQRIIEINKSVVNAAKLYFGFKEGLRKKIIISDATEIISKIKEKYDLIFVDAFGPNGAPKKLQYGPFLEQIYQNLESNGWAVGNYWTLDPFYPVQLSKWISVFDEVFQVRARPTGNMILFGKKKGKKCSINQDLQNLSFKAEMFREKTGLELNKMINNLKKIK